MDEYAKLKTKWSKSTEKREADSSTDNKGADTRLFCAHISEAGGDSMACYSEVEVTQFVPLFKRQSYYPLHFPLYFFLNNSCNFFLSCSSSFSFSTSGTGRRSQIFSFSKTNSSQSFKKLR